MKRYRATVLILLNIFRQYKTKVRVTFTDANDYGYYNFLRWYI